MANLTNVNRLSQETFNKIINGTHSTETYDDNAIYEVELDDPISVGDEDTGLTINDDNQLVVDLSASDIPNLTLSKISDVNATATQVNYLGTATSDIQTQLNNKEAADATILKQANVVDNTSSTSAIYPLSANMGKELQDQVNNLKSIGRFLSIWNASTGAPTSEPTTSPYTYKVGDYYRVGTEGTKNPAANLTYTTGGTNWVEGETLSVGDVVYCSTVGASSTTWVIQSSGGGGTVQDVQVDGTTILDSGTGIANINIDDDTLSFNSTTKTLSGYRYTVTVM